MTADLPSGPGPRPPRWSPALVVLIAVPVLIETVLVAADHGLIGTARWRQLAYQYGAFWAGLLHGWQPNFAVQPVTMFASYALLHTGPLHLAGNMLALALIGRRVIDRRGPMALLLVFLAATLGGGLLFGLLAQTAAPMVGASGALFGLAAALLVWRAHDRPAATGSALPELAAGTAGLVAINLPVGGFLGGPMAWQTHLGGLLAGAALATVWPRPPG